jgi:hypothetical protein
MSSIPNSKPFALWDFAFANALKSIFGKSDAKYFPHLVKQ